MMHNPIATPLGSAAGMFAWTRVISGSGTTIRCCLRKAEAAFLCFAGGVTLTRKDTWSRSSSGRWGSCGDSARSCLPRSPVSESCSWSDEKEKEMVELRKIED